MILLQESHWEKDSLKPYLRHTINKAITKYYQSIPTHCFNIFLGGYIVLNAFLVLEMFLDLATTSYEHVS